MRPEMADAEQRKDGLRLNDLIRISLRQVMRQRRRNIGVILTIALGTAGFIIVVTMSQDFKDNLNRDLDLLGGATRVKVHFETHDKDPQLFRSQWFRAPTVEALRDLPGVEAGSLLAMARRPPLVTIGKQQFHNILVGVDEYFWAVNSFTPEHGRFFDAAAVEGRQRVCVLGVDAARRFFDRTDVDGRLITIDRDVYRIVGVLGGLGLGDLDNWIFAPLTTALDRVRGGILPNVLYLRCDTWNDVEPAAKAAPAVVAALQPDDGLKVDVNWKRLAVVKRVAFWVELFVYVSIIATLVLGGFGIWNIMMVSVRARTREIGLKKAMGAEDGDILAQFLTEALSMCLAAALIGVLLGRLGVWFGAFMLQSPPPEDLFLLCVILGFMFSLILGVGAGLAPSLKASRMEVVTAVRYE
jgi:putative ABC transport system permease protein